MKTVAIERRSALAGVYHVGRHGHAQGEPGIRVRERRGLSIVQVAAFAHDTALPAEIATRVGVDAIPSAGHVVGDEARSIRPAGPRTWLVVLGAKDGALPELAVALAGRAVVTDLSHARTAIAIKGPAARDVLAQGTSIDLHPGVFGANACVQTRCGHIGVTLTRLAGDDAYELMCYRGYAVSLWEWLLAAGRSVGVEVLSRK